MDRVLIGALVQAAADGDAAAWKALVEGLSPLVWSVVRAHGLSDADAHEVYQTAWFRFAQHLRPHPRTGKGRLLAGEYRAARVPEGDQGGAAV